MRGQFDFHLSATSFLIPADWETNVRAVGPLVDAVELLFFDSRPAGSLPTRAVITGLARLARETGVAFNIHLPTDLAPLDADPAAAAQAREVLDHLIALTMILEPTAYTLHLPFAEPDRRPETIRRWQHRAGEFLRRLLQAHPDSRLDQTLTVENLDYPAEWVWDPAVDAGVGCCFDIGHEWVRGGEPASLYTRYADHVRIIHLHGVNDRQDHLPLTVLRDRKAAAVRDILSGFQGTVSIEVFNDAAFWKSAAWLEKLMR
jgi:sugar phosphate isomerase/epimerase